MEEVAEACEARGLIPMRVAWDATAPPDGLYERISLRQSILKIPFQTPEKHWPRIVQIGQEKGGDTLVISAYPSLEAKDYSWVHKKYGSSGFFAEVIFVEEPAKN